MTHMKEDQTDAVEDLESECLSVSPKKLAALCLSGNNEEGEVRQSDC